MQAGFDHYLVKPADPAALAALLAHAGHRQGK
jgi:CheY-like chemotaxis protein